MKQINKLFAILVLFLVTLTPIIAATETEVQEGVVISDPAIDEELNMPEEAGTLPGSPLYGFKIMGEKLKLAFTFKEERKLQLMEEHANRRLAEMRQLMQQGKVDKIPEVMNRYTNQIKNMYGRAEKLDNETLMQRIEERLQKRQEVLEKALEQVPEEAKPAILNAMQRQEEHKEQLMKRIMEREAEREQNMEKVMEKVQEKIKNKTGNGDGEVEITEEDVKEIVNEVANRGLGRNG